jgi:HAE1 family hydrophobic/amphiphilic exporter-1
MRFRWAVLLLSIGTIASNIYLYDLVKQDYIPTNVDESEFEVSVVAREGASLTAMTEVLERIENEIREIPGVELVMATVGTRGFGGVNRSELYVRLQDITTRAFSLGRLWSGIKKGDPGEAWRGNFTQRDVMKQVRGRLALLGSDVRIGVRNLTSLRQGSPVDIDFSITGPDIDVLNEFSEKLRRKTAGDPGRSGKSRHSRHCRCRYDLAAGQARAARRHRPRAVGVAGSGRSRNR